MPSERLIEIVAPRRLVAGDDAIDGLGAIIRELAPESGPVLVVSDRVIVELGLAERATRPLAAAGYDSVVFGEIAAEPDLPLIDRLAVVAAEESFVAVVGIGGGSALDPAKLAAAMATNDIPPVEIVEGRPLERPTLPLVLAPTTAGTGAEGSRNSVVAHDGRKRVVSSPYLCPSVALLDATLTVSSPPAVTAASGVDALCHAVESALSTYANPFTLANAFAAMRSIPKALPVAYVDGADLPARRAMLYAAYLAGLSLNAVTVLGHTMGYTIAGRTGLGHGITCAMSLPYCLAYNQTAEKVRLREIAHEVGAGDTELPLWSRRFGDGLQIPASLREVGIPSAAIEALAVECIERYPRPNNPVPFERDRLVRLYRRFYDGDIDGAVRDMAA